MNYETCVQSLKSISININIVKEWISKEHKRIQSQLKSEGCLESTEGLSMADIDKINPLLVDDLEKLYEVIWNYCEITFKSPDVLEKEVQIVKHIEKLYPEVAEKMH